MAITVADNFSYQGKKPLDGRDTFATLAAMKAYAEASVYDGCLSYCDEDGKRYEFKSTNTVDPTTGKWREYSSGGGGQTYNDFTGATSSTAGAHGLVPAPSAGDEGKVLFGNGLWGALPSVDLSVLSNEAFIFDATEKPVGQWTNRKLIYSKTVYVGALPNRTTTHTPHGISNIDEVVQCYGIKQYGHTGEPIPNNEPNDNSWAINLYIGDTEIQIKSGQNQSIAVGYVVIFYTKTTDSPLASDVKFAGVLSDGTVVYKKTVSTGGSVPSGATLIYRLPLLNSTDVVYYTLAS